MALVSFLMRWDGIDSGGISPKLSHSVIALIAFFLWGLGMALSKEFSPVAESDWNLPQQPWWPITAVAAFLVPWLFYRIAIRQLSREAIDQGHTESAPQ
jgi:hypothetical protein